MKRFLCLLTILLCIPAWSVSAAAETDYGVPLGAEYTQTVDAAFSFAFVGDTQIVAYKAPEKLDTIYEYLIANKDAKNIKFVAGLGDITDKSEAFEWDAAIKAIRKMDGILPYSLIRGNHDEMLFFRKAVEYESYVSQLEGMHNDTVFNTYQTVQIGTLQYLFLCLDHGPTDEALAWACDVVEKHPKHNVIVTTHGYINKEGELLTPDTTTIPPSETNGFNDAPAIWDQLVRKYENIVMVVCGHIGTAPEIVSYEVTGDHGNKIQQVLVNPQRVDRYSQLTGMVALFHFSADGRQVQVENYATLLRQHYGPGISFTLDSVGGNAHETPVNYPMIIAISGGAVALLGAIVSLLLRRRKKHKLTPEAI